MEPPETGTYPTFFDPALEILEDFSHQGRPQIWFSFADHICTTMTLEFRLFKMFFWGLGHCQVSREYDCHLRKFRQTAEEFQRHVQCVDRLKWRESDLMKQGFRGWQVRIEPFKRVAKEICILSLGGEIRCKPCQQDLELFLEYGRETASFIEFVLHNLQALLNSKHRRIDPAEHQQIDFITEKLQVFRKFANRVSHSKNRIKNLGELISQTRTWANHLSCFAFLYWIDRLDEGLASTVGTMLTDFMQETMSITHGVVASYFQDAPFPQILASYIDFLLEELVTPPVKDGIETLREGLIFLLSFMLDPPEKDSEDKELILGKIYSIINELPSLICSIHTNGMKDRISETKVFDFLQKIAGVEAEVGELYAITPRSAQFNSPRTNAIGFLDSLLQKLKKWLEGEVNLIARVKHGIQTVWEELAWLRHFMGDIMKLNNEQEELKNLWNGIVDVVYYAAYVTNLCAAKSFSIWFGIICLPSVIEEIKVIKNEVREINDPQMCKSKMLSVEMEFRNTMLPRTTTSKVEGAFIGFREETESIIDHHLIGGRKDLTIISIWGMPGQGKTTLAKRIYNDLRIQYHFQKTVWCYVSKECKIRDLMIGIVHDVRETDIKDISNVEIQDLAERLQKYLKGRRYLVVMDDIWDVGVWRQVQSSFPDNRNGSRIIFTSRNRNLISEGERNFISYPLRRFSQEESWDLMKEKLNGLGTEFEVIGKEIAKSCEGLPLAVALVTSLLGKIEQKLELWKQVAENLKSHLASEGSMHIIDLSYKYLPEHLKSCFLYFGAFPRGQHIRAKRLKLLWIAEGFIKGNEMRYSEDLADECLDYLVSQSLVVVVERSSMGRIKRCNVHDLLYDLCLKIIEEENFLHLVDSDTGSSPKKYGQHRLCFDGTYPSVELSTSPEKYGQHRLCIDGSDLFVELPTSPVQSLLWLGRFPSDLNEMILIKSFKVLTVLDLEDVRMKGVVFPEVILRNIHLKYLALWERFIDIPPLIAELWNLETLILRFIGFPTNRRIPDTLWRMKSLRHVRIDGGIVSLEDFEGKESYEEALDNNIETLGGLILEIDDQRTVEFLRRMTRLRNLKCRILGDALFSIFGPLENLEELHISGIRLDSETCIGSFPRNNNLRKLSLEFCRVALWSVLSTIGKHLPNLEVLKLESVKCEEGSWWDLEDGDFSKLRYLKLWDLFHLEEINVSDDCDNSFSRLEVLIVEECRSLKKIPSEIGEICSLNTIKMSWCSPEASKSVMQILEQQRDLGNHSLQVFVAHILEEEESKYLSHTMLPRTTTSKVEGAFIGFREDTNLIIVDHLVGGRKDLTSISISGMPGQGKTTLAKTIYNDPRIQFHFHKKVWCYVSKECKIRDLMNGIMHDVRKTDVEDISKLGIEDLADILRKSLKGKRYLVVMDDIWDDGVWCQVKSSFPDDKLGSRILFTSRNHNLKSQDERNFISYPLRSFSQEESWDLMKEKFNGLGTEFEVIGKEIAKSCEGLPLAVALVASLLGKTERKLELWNQVAENLKSHLAREGCMHVIELSYKYLPEHLKSCFLYFGAFPRGKNIRAKRLKLLWIAEGFIKGNEMRYSEDLAEECLDYLVSQSLVVVAEKNSMGGIKRCNVHDLIYDLCLGKIAEENFVHWPQKYGHYRLCIGESNPFMEARPICRRKELPTSLVESLLWSNCLGSVSFDFLKSFKVLTVLDLEEVYLEGDVFPEVILCNIHLKYLAFCGSFKNIPPSIAELRNLETLILVGGFIGRVIPNSMWRMKSLRHVIIYGGCVSLEDFEGNESHVAALDNNIETLSGLSLEIDDQRAVEFLGRMTRLRKLKCHFQGDALFSFVGSLENLEELKLSGGIFNDLIFETCSFPQNLRKLSLEFFGIASWSVLSTIGKHLLNLEVLKLESVSCKEGSRWDLEDGEFSKLRYLKLSRLDDLEEINVSLDCDISFPCLEVLIVEDCRKFKEIPSEIGKIDSLNTIKMSWCSRKASESVMQILEQQHDSGNQTFHVFVTDIR